MFVLGEVGYAFSHRYRLKSSGGDLSPPIQIDPLSKITGKADLMGKGVVTAVAKGDTNSLAWLYVPCKSSLVPRRGCIDAVSSLAQADRFPGVSETKTPP